MKRYLVNVANLTPDSKEALRENLKGFSFFVEDVLDERNFLKALIVNWNANEDFQSTNLLPPECTCIEI